MTGLREALEPVRTALLDRARADADATGRRAAAEAATALGQARARAAEIVAAARADGRRDAETVRARDASRADREARETVLRAQREAYDRLRRDALSRVCALRDDPGYPALLDRLRDRAAAALGNGAVVHEHPDGGIVAEAAGRRLDLSLPALADRAVDDLGAEVTRLWTPDG